MEMNKEQWVSWLQTKGLSPRTIKNYMDYFKKIDFSKLKQSYLIAFLKRYNNLNARAMVKNLILYVKTNDFPEDVKALFFSLDVPKQTGRVEVKIPKVISKGEVMLIYKEMIRKRDKIMLLLTFYCGLRLNELLSIKPYDFQWKRWEKMPSEAGVITIKGKGRKERNIPVIPKLMTYIYHWITEDVSKKQLKEEPLFNIGESRWQKILNKYSEKALSKRINPHLLRHSSATYLLEQGLNIQEIQEFLGHSNINSTLIYLHINKEKLGKKVSDAFS